MSRYQGIAGGAVLLGALVLVFGEGATRMWLLAGISTLAGLTIGLGVSFPQWQLFGDSLCRIGTQDKVVALTFDDGPDPETTPALLDLLAQRKVRVTFFCIAEKASHQAELVRRMAAEGHGVENHSFGHSPWTNLFSVRRLRGDMARAQTQLEQLTGRAPAFFRPPMGLTNQRVFRVAAELGLRVAGYTVRGLDRRSDPPETIVARLRRGLGPGAILLLHDAGVQRQRLLAVVTMLLDTLQSGGYRCARLDDLCAAESPRRAV